MDRPHNNRTTTPKFLAQNLVMLPITPKRTKTLPQRHLNPRVQRHPKKQNPLPHPKMHPSQ